MDYAATHPEAKIRYRASEMILHIHTDASYLSELKARSRAAGHYFLRWLRQTNQPIRLNGAIHTLCTVVKFLASSAAEAELGALFLDIKNFYLCAPMKRFEYTKMTIGIFSRHFVQEYNLGKRYTRDAFGLKFEGAYMDSHRLENLQMSSSRKS